MDTPVDSYCKYPTFFKNGPYFIDILNILQTNQRNNSAQSETTELPTPVTVEPLFDVPDFLKNVESKLKFEDVPELQEDIEKKRTSSVSIQVGTTTRRLYLGFCRMFYDRYNGKNSYEFLPLHCICHRTCDRISKYNFFPYYLLTCIVDDARSSSTSSTSYER
jgi:hypothetical protein